MTLIDQLLEQLDITRQQAEGGVGLLLRHAQTCLSADEFAQVADAIPAISDLIGKAPRQVGPTAGSLQTLWRRWFSGWGELAPLQASCEQMDLDRAMIDKFIAVIGSYFRKHGSAEVESLLLGLWR